jgi:hypothetical protein
VNARILEARLRVRLAATDPETHHPVLSYSRDRTDRDARGGKDDRLYQAAIDGGGVTSGDKMVLAAGCPSPVLASKDDGRCETEAKGKKVGDVCG